MRSCRFAIATAALMSLTGAASYQVNNGSNTDITEHTVCRNVANSHASGQPIFVPTNTSTEWASFYNNPPSGISVGACAPANCTLPWGGTIASGASVTAYSTAAPACTQACTAVDQVRTCTNGVLSGSFTNQNCTNHAEYPYSAGSQTYSTAGTFSFNVPCHTTLTVVVRGAGGGGYGGTNGSDNTVAGTAGGVSRWNNTVIANGGASAQTGGTASGGTTNTTGGAGAADTDIGGNGGAGGAGAGSGGAGGATETVIGAGNNGTAPGGGGSGARTQYAMTSYGHRGAGGGGYSTRAYSAGTFTPGNNVAVVVGAAGQGGGAVSGGDGGAGRVVISW